MDWQPITKLDRFGVTQRARLEALGALHSEWQRRFSTLDEESRLRIRQATLNKLAIETGVIEGLYEIEWGLTLTLIAEGFTRDVVERVHGHIDEETLTTIRANRESLALVLEFVRQDRKLTPFLIKEMHQAVTQTQRTYRGRDALGTEVDVPLTHGQWKIHPNHVALPDGSTHYYCPPEQVASEIDNLTNWYEELDRSDTHPLAKAAWLHHRFVQIHPFADGNGRLARALTTLVMERERWAPIVVDRHHRVEYLDALNAANHGSLDALLLLFVELEAASLTSELANPTGMTSSDMVRALAERQVWKQADERLLAEQRNRINIVANAVNDFFGTKRNEIADAIAARRVSDVRVGFHTFKIDRDGGIPWTAFGEELVASASRAGHSAQLDIVGGAELLLHVGAVEHRFRAAVYRVDDHSGVMAVTVFGSVPTTADAFRFVYSEDLPGLRGRLSDLTALLDRGLSEVLGAALRGG